jgi:hypothetical protein
MSKKLTPVFKMIGEVLSVYKKNYKTFLWLAVAGILFYFLSTFAAMINLLEGGWLKNILALVLSLGSIAVIYFYMRTQISFVLAIKNPGQSFKEVFKNSNSYFWKFLLVSILTGILVILWSLLLIIPGIIFAVFYSLAIYTLFFEDFAGRQALRRSQELIKGYWWAVFGRLLFAGVLFFIVIVIWSLPVSLIVGLLSLIPGAAFVASIVGLLLVNFALLLLQQMYMIYFYLIYRDTAAVKGKSNLEKGKTSKVWAIILTALFFLLYLSSFLMTIYKNPEPISQINLSDFQNYNFEDIGTTTDFNINDLNLE